jgi:hypothetical protein
MIREIWSRNKNCGVIIDPKELMPFIARPRSKAVGALQGVSGMIHGGEVDLTANFNFRGAEEEHSAQFNWNIQRLDGFYSQLLENLFSQQP